MSLYSSSHSENIWSMSRKPNEIYIFLLIPLNPAPFSRALRNMLQETLWRVLQEKKIEINLLQLLGVGKAKTHFIVLGVEEGAQPWKTAPTRGWHLHPRVAGDAVTDRSQGLIGHLCQERFQPRAWWKKASAWAGQLLASCPADHAKLCPN